MPTHHPTTRLASLGLLAAALLVGAATLSLAQAPGTVSVLSVAPEDRSAFYLESIRPAVERLQSLTSNGLDGAARPYLSSSQYSIGYDGQSSLHRDVVRTVADMQTAPLGVSFQDTTTTRGLLSLSQHTGLSYTNTVTQSGNLIGLTLGQTEVSTYGLREGLGGGTNAGALSLTRTQTQAQSLTAPDANSVTDVASFQGGLRRANDLSLRGLRTVSDASGGYSETGFEGSYTAALSGGASSLGYARNSRIAAGLATTTERSDLTLPIAWRGQRLVAEHHTTYSEAPGALTSARTSHLLVPFAALGPGTALDYTLAGVSTNGALTRTNTARLTNPFTFSGRSYGLEESYTTSSQPGLSSDTFATRLSAPLAGGQAIVQQQSVSTDTGGALTRQRQLSLALPAFARLRVVSAQAVFSATAPAGTPGDSLQSFAVSVQPLRPLLVDAAYSIADRGDLQSAKTRQLRTRLALTRSVSLHGQLSETEQFGGGANALRFVELRRDRSAGGVGLQAGYASYLAPDRQPDDARRIELALGRPQVLAIEAAYSEYDVATMAPLPNDDAIIALCLRHGDPKDFAIRARYEDQPTRPSPLRALDVALPLLGADLVASYQENPLAPDGVTVRSAVQYDAGLVRKVFGDVSLQLGYRYLDRDTDLVDRNIRIQLNGGQEARTGRMAFAYATGDFCTAATGVTAIPGATFDLTYSKIWAGSSRFTLGVQHRTAPWRGTGDTTTEGRLEYSLGF